MRTGALILAGSLLVLAGCTEPGPQQPKSESTATQRVPSRPEPPCGAKPPAAGAGPTSVLTIPVDPASANGVASRTAVVHVPVGYDGHPAPVVVQFHGAAPTASAQDYQQSSMLSALADSAGFIDVLPQGLRMWNGNLAWNVYGPVLFPVAEIPFVDAVLDAVESRYCVDVRRVYASGTSNGGNMAGYLACRDAQRIAAVALVVAPTFGQDDGPCAPSQPVSILDIHSVDDPLVPYSGQPATAGGFAQPAVLDWLAGWARLDHCRPDAPSRTVTQAEASTTWTHCDESATVTGYAVHAGHGWPDRVSDTPTAHVVWAFLSAHRRS